MRAVSGFRARTHVRVVWWWWGAAVVVEVWESGALDGSRDSLCSRVNEWWYGEARCSSRVLEGYVPPPFVPKCLAQNLS